ncbi:MAG: L-threonylcarbamoyladenylate synthase [Patescibacteria group bacterium]
MRFVRVSDVGYEEAAREAARALSHGGIVLYPTDTLYGLAADVENSDALERLWAIKERDAKKPVSIVVPDVHALYEHGKLAEQQAVFAHTHLPGALTLVVLARDHLPDAVVYNGAVAMRVPNDPFVRALGQEFFSPYTATSANKAGQPTQSTATDIIVSLGAESQLIDLVIDDGPRDAKLASTIVLYTGDKPLVLRDGALSREALGIS